MVFEKVNKINEAIKSINYASYLIRISSLIEDKANQLCPQPGLIFKNKDVERFINWFAELKVGVLKS
jgi:hypothetical protein